MRRRFAFTAALAAITQLWACGEFVSDAPDDANLSNAKDTGRPNGKDASVPDAKPSTGDALEFASCLDPKVSGALLCEDFIGGAKLPTWSPRPAGLVPMLVQHDTPDLWIKGAHKGLKEFYQHDFADRSQGFQAQLTLTVNAAVQGKAQVFAFFLGSSRSLGFFVEGQALSVFRYDDDATNFKSLVSVKPHLDQFFEKVMVMVEDGELKKQRLALLSKLVRAFRRVADLSEIQAPAS